MKLRYVLLWVLVMTLLDQGVKGIIYMHYMDLRFSIIPSLLEFYPKFNYNHSYLNDLFKLGMTKWIHMVIFFSILLFTIFLYAAMRNVSHKNKLIDWAFIMGFSGIICAIISNLFWEGVLDFIYLVPLFVFDLKDVYINLFVALVLLAIVLNRKLITEKRIGIYLSWSRRKCRAKIQNRSVSKP